MMAAHRQLVAARRGLLPAGTKLTLGVQDKGFKTWVWAQNEFVVGVLNLVERQDEDMAAYLQARIPAHVSWDGDVSAGGVAGMFLLSLFTLRWQLLTSF